MIMNTTRIYRVADLPFRVNGSGDTFLPDSLMNMKPFVSALKPGENPLFEIDIIHGPLPETPVMTTSLPRGISTVIPLRLFSRAFLIIMLLSFVKVYKDTKLFFVI